MRRKPLPPPPPPPEGHVLVTVQWPDGATSLEPIPNYHMEADCARRLKRAPEPAWRDDPSYSWRRGKR